MKTKIIITASCLLFMIVSTVLISCEKTVGPKGDAGLQGPAGSTVLSGTGAPALTLGNAGDFYLDLSSSLFYGPKKTDTWGTGFSMIGATGATGATGPAGANGTNGKDGTNGANGANGAAGKPGSKIISGTGTPAADIGVEGDYYLDKDSYSFYGPKLATGWGAGVSLKGPIGTANVLYSGWAYATFFRDSTIDNTFYHMGDLAAPALTTEILNSGTVMLYFNYGGGVLPLPYTSYAGGKMNTISYLPRLKRFIITRFAVDNSNTIALSTMLQYRYVIIPGGVKTGSIDLKDYQQVKKQLNIPD